MAVLFALLYIFKSFVNRFKLAKIQPKIIKLIAIIRTHIYTYFLKIHLKRLLFNKVMCVKRKIHEKHIFIVF